MVLNFLNLLYKDPYTFISLIFVTHIHYAPVSRDYCVTEFTELLREEDSGSESAQE